MEKTKTFSGNKVPKLTKIIFPWSGIFRDACYALIGTFLMTYAQFSGVLSSTSEEEYTSQVAVITIAMVIALIWDGINDPIMGFILEKCHFKSGKFRPWIEIGAIGNALCVLTMFLAPMIFTGLRGWAYVTFMIIMYAIWDLLFTMNDIGYWSMLPALTNDPEERAKLTTQTAIAASIGAFMMNVAMIILPGTFAVSTIQIYAYAGTGIAILFLISQTLIYLLCQEKERDEEQEKISEQASILDLFKVVIQNKQLLFATIGLMLYYFGNYIITSIGQIYFYMVFGYGGGKGGMVATVIALIYVISTIVAQAFYPTLIKKFSKQKLLTMSTIVLVIAYVGFFLTAFPVFGEYPLAYNTVGDNVMWVLGGTMFLYYVLAFLFFGASGIYYLVNLVMFQDAIDYNEWKFGERKESICFAWRPLDVKLASGFNRILQFVTFALTGTMAYNKMLSTEEGKYNAYIASHTDQALIDARTALRDATIENAKEQITSSQLAWFGVIIIGTILVVFIASYCLLHFGYKIDEDMEKQIVAELEQRHKANENVAETTETVTNETEQVAEEPTTDNTTDKE